ncbi:MAG: hypothetical protein HY690_19135 [Chloroflexi bacterium]|nr:hypothetical protein [Chloroflexota bacterium]
MAQEPAAPQYVRPEEQRGLRRWKCKTCQFVVEAELLPFRCPRCGASRVKMEEVASG